jgi:hypothetical protein
MRAPKGSFSLRAAIPCALVKNFPFRFNATFSAKYLTGLGDKIYKGPVFKCTLKSFAVANDYFLDYIESIPFGFVFRSEFFDSPECEKVVLASSISHSFSINVVVPKKKFQGTGKYSLQDPYHQILVKRILENSLEKHPEVPTRLKNLFEKSIDQANKKVIEIIARLRHEKTNEEIRKGHLRENHGYYRSTSILRSLFFNSEISTLATRIYISENKKLVFPSDKAFDIQGCRTKVITFGVTPYPFAVVMVYESEPFGTGDSLTQKEQLVIVAEVDGRFVIVPMHVSHTAPEDQLEMAAMMGVSSEIQKPAVPISI